MEERGKRSTRSQGNKATAASDEASTASSSSCDGSDSSYEEEVDAKGEQTLDEQQPSTSKQSEATNDYASKDGMNGPQKKKRTRRGVTDAMRAKRAAESKKDELISKGKDTDYIYPLSAEGIKAIQDQLKKKRSIQSRLVVPPPKGCNPTLNKSAASNPFVKASKLPAHLAMRKPTESSEFSKYPTVTSPGGSRIMILDDDDDFPVQSRKKTAIISNLTRCDPLPIAKPAPMIDAKPFKPLEIGEIKTEEPDVDEMLSPHFIAVDVSENGAGGKSVKLEVEEPIEAPDAQPLRCPPTIPPRNGFLPHPGAIPNASMPIRADRDMKQRRLNRRQEDLQSKTLEYWEGTAQATLMNCTLAIKQTVSHAKQDAYIDKDMIYVMAEFLKPALMRLDQIEQQKDLTVGHDWQSQETLESASKKLLDRVSRQEAQAYKDEHVPIVKFARAFATFADRFCRLSKDMIQFIDPDDPLFAQAPSTDQAFRNYEEEMFRLSGKVPNAPSNGLRVQSAWDADDLIEDNHEEERNGETSRWNRGEMGAKRRKTLFPQTRELTQQERLIEYDGDSSVIHRRKIVPVQMPNVKTKGIGSRIQLKRSFMTRTCPYCQDDQLSEATLIEHVKRMHFEEWKRFAPFMCKFHPHCDYRTVKKWHMDEHNQSFHDDKYKAWIMDNRMTIEGNCPFCPAHLYNIHLLHDHLEDKHNHCVIAAFQNNCPFIGCGSCTFSSFWACDVYRHWRERPMCTGSLTIRKINRFLMEPQPVLNTGTLRPTPRIARPVLVTGKTLHLPTRPAAPMMRVRGMPTEPTYGSALHLAAPNRYRVVQSNAQRQQEPRGGITMAAAAAMVGGSTQRLPTPPQSSSRQGAHSNSPPENSNMFEYDDDVKYPVDEFSAAPTDSTTNFVPFDDDMIKKEEEMD